MKEKSRELLQTISAGEIPADLSRKSAQDALNIVIDAINSTVGGLIITDLSGSIRFANQSFCNKIKTLRGIIPICAACKKIRDDKGYWNQLENYIKEHSEADFSHGICPECAIKLYPELHEKARADQNTD